MDRRAWRVVVHAVANSQTWLSTTDVPCYTVLYYTVLYYIILYYGILYSH